MADKEWLASLKKGDDVAIMCYKPGLGRVYSIGTITKITPTGQIQINGNDPKYRNGEINGDQYNNGPTLKPLTDEIRETVFREEACLKLRNTKYERLSTEKLRKIKAVLMEE